MVQKPPNRLNHLVTANRQVPAQPTTTHHVITSATCLIQIAWHTGSQHGVLLHAMVCSGNQMSGYTDHKRRAKVACCATLHAETRSNPETNMTTFYLHKHSHNAHKNPNRLLFEPPTSQPRSAPHAPRT